MEDSGVAGDTVLVLLPLPRDPLLSLARTFCESRVRLEFSGFKGDADPSARPIPFDGLSGIKKTFVSTLTKAQVLFISIPSLSESLVSLYAHSICLLLLAKRQRQRKVRLG